MISEERKPKCMYFVPSSFFSTRNGNSKQPLLTQISRTNAPKAPEKNRIKACSKLPISLICISDAAISSTIHRPFISKGRYLLPYNDLYCALSSPKILLATSSVLEVKKFLLQFYCNYRPFLSLQPTLHDGFHRLRT